MFSNNFDTQEIKRANAYPDCDNNETSITKVDETDSTKDTLAQESGKVNADPICDNNESNTTTVDEADKAITSESGELINSENTKCRKSVPTKNSQHVDKDSDCPQTVGPGQKENILHKYWHQRYRLFHRFDEGVMLDEGK